MVKCMFPFIHPTLNHSFFFFFFFFLRVVVVVRVVHLKSRLFFEKKTANSTLNKKNALALNF